MGLNIYFNTSKKEDIQEKQQITPKSTYSQKIKNKIIKFVIFLLILIAFIYYFLK